MSAVTSRQPVQIADEQQALLRRLAEGLDPSGLLWASGYLAGLAAAQAPPLSIATGAQAAIALRVSVVYGTQTGNSRRIAEQVAEQAKAAGFDVRLLSAGKYPLRELEREQYLVIVISTQGDGDPPDDARDFVEHLLGRRAPRLPELRYAVLALGDSSYPKFCETGRKLDARLSELGARALLPRADADLDIESVAPTWLGATLTALRDSAGDALQPRATVTPLRPGPPSHTRERPFAAEILVNQRITAREAGKDVRHLEFSLAGSGLRYEPGDALGVLPRNPRLAVDDLLALTQLDGDSRVSHGGHSRTLREWLTEAREITRLSRPVIATHAARADAAELNRLLAPEHQPALAQLIATHQFADLLRAYPADWSPEELVEALRPLTPRLYSIASSMRAVGDEAHVTVAVVDYALHGRRHLGAASGHLSTELAEGDRARLFIESNERFRLPADGARDVIMIGAGTGVAPYRGFLQEREATGASGRHWLFFGEQHRESTFLYQLEWLDARARGSLHRLDLAFSRDQAEKVYVQHRLREQGAELLRWLRDGAHLYVCGDAKRLAPGVHAALRDVIVTHGGRSPEDAEAELAQLAREHRYLRDVY